MSTKSTVQPAATAAVAAAPRLVFPSPALFEEMEQDKIPLVLGSLPRRFVSILQSLSCTSCNKPFGAACPPITAPCDHLFCSRCIVPRFNEETKTNCFHCSLCDKLISEKAIGDATYEMFVHQKLLMKLYGYLQNGKGFRCGVCRELHPRLNTVRCTSDDCDWMKKKREAKDGIDSEDESPREVSISLHLSREPFAKFTTRKKRLKGAESVSTVTDQLPKGTTPSVHFDEREEMEKRKKSDEDDMPSCSSSSQFTVEDESTIYSSFPSISSLSESDYISSPFTCVWCATEKHRRCDLVMITEEEEEQKKSERRSEGETLASFDCSFKEPWALVFCGLCWERFDPNEPRKNKKNQKKKKNGLFSFFAALKDAENDYGAISMSCGCGCCIRQIGGGCIHDFEDDHTIKQCNFCFTEVDVEGMDDQYIVYLNDLLRAVKDIRLCRKCGREHPVSNMEKFKRRCVWCELEWLEYRNSTQH